MKKGAALLGALVAMVIVTGGANAQIPWYDSTYSYRYQTNITNPNQNTYLASEIAVNITVNTSLSLYNDGRDVAVVYWDGSSHTVIDRINTSPFNEGDTELWFRLQDNIEPGASRENYSVYLSKTTTSTQPSDCKNIFVFCEDFDNFTVGNALGGQGDWTGLVSTLVVNTTVDRDPPNSLQCGQLGPTDKTYINLSGFINVSLFSHYFPSGSSPEVVLDLYDSTTNLLRYNLDGDNDRILIAGNNTGLPWTNSEWNKVRIDFFQNSTLNAWGSSATDFGYLTGIVFSNPLSNNISEIRFVDTGSVNGLMYLDLLYMNKHNGTEPTFVVNSVEDVFPEYNITIFEEMTENYFNLGNPKINSSELIVYCPQTTLRFNITNDQIMNISCDFDQLELRIDWDESTSVTGSTGNTVFRTLKTDPFGDITLVDVEFYMPDASNETYTTYFQKLEINDVTGVYTCPTCDGIVEMYKILSDGNTIMIEQDVGSGGEVLLYYIVNEQYSLIVKATGQPNKVISKFAGLAEVTISLTVSDLPYIPEKDRQTEDVFWSITGDRTLGIITLVYNDTLVDTSLLTMTVYNGTDNSVLTSEPFIPSSQVTQIVYNIPNVNETYIVTMTAQHGTFGEIKDSTVISFIQRLFTITGLPENWYAILGLSLVVFLGLIFGSFHAGMGSFVMSLGAGAMWFWGFIDAYVGFGVIALSLFIAGVTMISERRNAP